MLRMRPVMEIEHPNQLRQRQRHHGSSQTAGLCQQVSECQHIDSLALIAKFKPSSAIL